jgi:predicted nucleotidyltransferase
LKAWSCSARVRTRMIPLPRDFRDFLRLLNENEIKYVVIGGYAVAYHGYVRYTGDLDVFVEFSKDNAQKLVTAFREFGFASARVSPALFLKKGKIIRMGSEPMRLEVLNEIDGVSFNECFEHRRVTKLANLKINFIDLPRLLKNKRASGRLKDLGDVEALLRKTKRKSKARKSK